MTDAQPQNPALQPEAQPLARVLGHRGLHPAELPRRPQRGRLPAARRRRHHQPRRARIRHGHHRRRGHRGHRPTRGRQLRLRRLPDQRRRPAGTGPGDRRDHHHPGRAGVLRPAPPRRAGPPGHRRPTASTPCTSTRWTASCPSAPAATAPPSTSTSTSSTAPAARTSRSAASPASPPRPATHCSCCTPSSAPACSAQAPSTPRRWSSPSRARTCCSSTTPTSGSTTNSAQQYAELGLPAEPFNSVGFSPRPPPTTPPADRTSPAAPAASTPSGGPCTSSAPGTAALRLHRRRGRTQPVHDGRQPGRRPAAAGRATRRQRRRRQHRRRHLPHLRRTGRRHRRPAHRRRHPPATGPGRSPASAPSTPSSAGFAARSSRCRAADPRRPARHRHRAQDLHRNQQVTVVDLHNLRERAQRFVVGVVLPPKPPARKPPGRAACCSP